MLGQSVWSPEAEAPKNGGDLKCTIEAYRPSSLKCKSRSLNTPKGDLQITRRRIAG